MTEMRNFAALKLTLCVFGHETILIIMIRKLLIALPSGGNFHYYVYMLSGKQ